MYGGKPSEGVCARCASYDGPMRGLGDVVAAGIKVATLGKVKPCGGCQRRRAAMNDRIPL